MKVLYIIFFIMSALLLFIDETECSLFFAAFGFIFLFMYRKKNKASRYVPPKTGLKKNDYDYHFDSTQSTDFDVEKPTLTDYTHKAAKKSPKLPNSYVVFDTETTGLDSKRDKIIEIAGVKVKNGTIVNTFSSLINPDKNISKKITEITGLTNEDLKYAPYAEAVISDFCEFAEGFVLVAHNAEFDMRFLNCAICEFSLDYDFEYVDTLSLARKAFPDLHDHKLATLIEEFHLADGEQTHRALDDAMATQKLFEILKEKEKQNSAAS